jgi:serine/threonine protein kinase
MSSSAADAPGTVTAGAKHTWAAAGYTEVRLLGEGGFGKVVLATHDASGTAVAIKYLHPDLLRDQGHVAMFRAEARTLAGLDSPHVVRLYEYVEGPGGAAIVMELVEGVTLARILESEGKTTPQAALVVLYGSLLGLAAAHARGVVHRDYKPANVLIDGQGTSKLTDFGIAALAGGRPVPAGTLRYMPPEQFEGAAASPAADVYAATVTFYQCLAGRVPFDGQSATELYDQHKSADVPMDPVPEALRPIIARGLAKDPRYRPADAGRLAAELRDAAADGYGTDWEDRGRGHLAEAALLLLARLWPSGTAPAAGGTTVAHTPLGEPGARPAPPAH